MPRKYIKKLGARAYANYSDASVEEALLKIANGELSVLAASKKYSIPYGTLHNRYHGKHTKSIGGQTVFSNEEEKVMINAVIKCGDWGFPLTLMDLRIVAKSYLDTKGVIVQVFGVDNLPGDDWARSLLKRHQIIGQRLATNISRVRADVSPAIINEYFDNLNEVLENVPPENIFNYDESNLQDDPGKLKVLFKRGTKYPVKVQNHSKSATTIMVCGSASGTLLPPYVVYRSAKMWESWTVGGPKGAPCCLNACCSKGSRFNCTSHGWMDLTTFQDWFFTCFMPHARRLPGKKVLIGDNLASHFNPEVIKECEISNVIFACLPKNSTHITQPLDVCFFRPLKQAWRFCLSQWKNKNTRLNAIPKSTFPSLVKEALDRVNTVGNISENLISGFKATGIYPCNRQVILNKFPREVDEAVVNDTLTTYLKSQRFDKTDKNQKRKKINVAPGKSVTSAILGGSNSDIEDEIIPFQDTDSEEETNDYVPEYYEPSINNIKIGTFILVKVMFGRRKNNKFQYVAVVRKITDGVYSVNGLKSIELNKTMFKIVENDIFEVGIEHIIATLPMPTVETVEDSVRYLFSFDIDIKEA